MTHSTLSKPNSQRILTLFQWSMGCLALLLTTTMLTGCNGSKAFVKRAKKMEEAGMMPQAADLYYTAVMKKSTNVDAVIGLQRTGQVVLGQHIAKFDEGVARNDRELAIGAWADAEAWQNKCADVGAALVFPEAKRSTYESVKNAHLDATYQQANILLEQEQFAEAQLEFDAILALDPNYQDAQDLRTVAYCEPRYREGVQAQKSELYRTAHRHFSDLLGTDATYKDAQQRLNDVLEDGRFTLALVEFKNATTRPNVEVKMQSLVEQSLMGSTDPFLKVVDRESLMLIMQEQQMGLSGLTSTGDVEIGNLLGAKALLKATVTMHAHNQSPLKKSTKTGHQRFRVERVNEEGKKYYETKYRPVPYRSYEQTADLTMTVSFKFISTETGEVLQTQTVDASTSDVIEYIEFEGERNSFFLSDKGSPWTNSRGRKQRNELLAGRQQIRSADVMTEEVGTKLASQIQALVESQLRAVIQ